MSIRAFVLDPDEIRVTNRIQRAELMASDSLEHCKRIVFPSGDWVTFGLTIGAWNIQKKPGQGSGFADGGRLQRSDRL